MFWTRNPGTFLFEHNAKHNYLEEKCIGLSFCAGPSLPGLGTVFVLLFEREEYFHSTSHKNKLYESLRFKPAVNRQPGFRR